MGRFFRSIALCLCALVAISSIPIFAIENVSDLICQYEVTVYESNNLIAVEFDVSSLYTMDCMGAESIAVYYKDGNRWIFLDEKTRDNNGMSRTNATSFSNTICFDGDSGNDYKVVVEIFAENDEGYDSRIQTFYISL